MRSTKLQASTGDKSPDFTSSSTVCFKTKLQKETKFPIKTMNLENYMSFFRNPGFTPLTFKKKKKVEFIPLIYQGGIWHTFLVRDLAKFHFTIKAV